MNVFIHNLNEVASSESILIGSSEHFFKFTRTDEGRKNTTKTRLCN